MMRVDEAIEIILNTINPIAEIQFVDLFNGGGRILAEDVYSPFDVPPLNNSAMDGYAIISSDTKSASEDNPCCLKIINEIRAGEKSEGVIIQPGFATTIMTGAPLPEGADCIVPFEDAQEEKGILKIKKPIKPFDNVRFAGEDIKKGTLVLPKGTRLDSAEIGLLASVNIHKIPVFRKPKVAIISTGDEIIEPGETKETHKIYNSNAYVIYNEVLKYGGEPHYFGIVADDRENTLNKISQLFDHDIIISSGGVSMGRYDFIPEILSQAKVEIKVHKVLMKPGKPVLFGASENKIYFGLPGNPVSVMISFLKFVRPAILKLSGAARISKPVITAKAGENFTKKKGRRFFLRGIYSEKNGELYVNSTGAQGSGILSSMSRANCLIILPEDCERIGKDEKVQIELIHHREI